MARRKTHPCRVCGRSFGTITDHMIHVTEDHDLRRTGGSDRPRTIIACRSCGLGDHIDGAQCDRCGTPLALS